MVTKSELKTQLEDLTEEMNNIREVLDSQGHIVMPDTLIESHDAVQEDGKPFTLAVLSDGRRVILEKRTVYVIENVVDEKIYELLKNNVVKNKVVKSPKTEKSKKTTG